MGNLTFRETLVRNQVVRFVFSAGIGFAADLLAFYLLDHNLLQQPTYRLFSLTFDNFTIALAISFFLGVVVNFLITKYFVFSESVSSPTKQFVRFVSVAILGFFANLTLLDMFVKSLYMNATAARICAALTLFLASFFVHKFFSFSLSFTNAARAGSKASN